MIKQRSVGTKTFVLALLLGLAIFLPFLLMDRGIFILYGDYNVQQIPFYQLAHRAVRSGEIFWNWNTDLGANFIGSYSFYLLFSPFFWVTLPFPTSWVPYLMAPLLILKTALACTTASLYLSRFVKDKKYALVGGLLYGFSGWMFFNIFFNHFHDVAVFFPLLLLALERLVVDDKKIFFGLMVAVSAMVNYWFFVGEVVFIVIYVIIRSYSGGWGISWKKLGTIAVEAVLGLLLACVAVVPSILAIMGNPRTEAGSMISGWSMWTYWYNTSEHGDHYQRVLAILQSMIFPPELVAYPNFFANHGAQWASMSAWLPLFSTAGVIAFFTTYKNKKHWLKKMLAFLLFMAVIPVLNSAFVAFNGGYYARWFYMGILLMALATVVALEQSVRDPRGFREGIKWTFITATLFAVAVGLTPQKSGDEWTLGLAKNLPRVWIWYGFVVLGLVLVTIALVRFRRHPLFMRVTIAFLSVMIVSFGVTYLAIGRWEYPRSQWVLDTALGKQGKILLPNEFARVEPYEEKDNIMMYWGFPTIQAFHSVVPPSIMEFYDTIGVDRDEGSRPEVEHVAIRSLLSVKWLMIGQDVEKQDPMPHFQRWEEQEGYIIYENLAHIPMGFTYDYLLTEEELMDAPKKEREYLMLKGIVLEKEAILDYGGMGLMPLPDDQKKKLTDEDLLSDALNRGQTTVDDFTVTKDGFTASTDFAMSEVVFFSVPSDDGWSATIDGEPADILKANIGFMAILVPEGAHSIEFIYRTPGLPFGAMISLGAGMLFVLYWWIGKKMKMKNQKKKAELERLQFYLSEVKGEEKEE